MEENADPIIVKQRMRNHIIEQFETISNDGFSKLGISKAISLWDFFVNEDMKDYICEPVFSLNEIKAIWKFDSIWESTNIEGIDDQFNSQTYSLYPEIEALVLAAQDSLEVFKKRGEMPEDKNIFTH